MLNRNFLRLWTFFENIEKGRPVYNPNMTQNEFSPPSFVPGFTPVPVYNPNHFISRSPLIIVRPLTYRPVMTEPSFDFRRPLPNLGMHFSPRKRPKILINPNNAKIVKKVDNQYNRIFTINFSRKIGEGFYSIIYLGTFHPNNIEVAVKMPREHSLYNYVSNEIKIYQKLNGLNGIPKIYWLGKYKNKDTIVFQILGDSLNKDFNNNNKKYDLWKIKRFGLAALDLLESIHGKKIVHGDIKPSCFHYGKNDGKIYLIDFGFSFEFMNGFSHIPFQQGVHSLSDIKFCSRNVCKSYQKSRRDDIESLGYVLIYLMTGFLPWESSNNHMNIVKFKLSMVLDSLCYGLSNNIRQFINYAWNLKFEENQIIII